MGDGPLIKKPRIETQVSTDFDYSSLEELLPDELLPGGDPGRPHENGILLNGTMEASPAYTENSAPFPNNTQNHVGGNALRHSNLSQLLAKTPHSQPMHNLPLDLPSNVTGNSPALSTPPGSVGQQQAQQGPALMNNPRASPAMPSSSSQLRQSPQLPRTGTPGGHPNLQFTTNGPGSQGPPTPAGLHLFHNNTANYNGNDVQFHGHPQQQQQQQPPPQHGGARMAFSNGPMSNGPMGGGSYGQNGQPVMMNGPSPQQMMQQQQNGPAMLGGMPRTSSAGNLLVQQGMANAGVRPTGPGQIRMPGGQAQPRPNMARMPGGMVNGPMPNGPMTNGPMSNGPPGQQQQPGPRQQFMPQQQNSFSPPPPQHINLNPVSPGMPNNLMQQQQQQQQQQPNSQPQPPSMGMMPQQQPMSVGSSVQNQLSPPNVGDPEKRKIIQQQLVLLLHAHKCQRREQVNADGIKRECTLPHCRTMKNVLTHMTQCQAGKACQMPHCASSRQIIQHWKTCTRTDCPVCLPLKQASDRQRPAFDFPPAVQMQGNNNQPGLNQPGGGGGPGNAVMNGMGPAGMNNNFPGLNGGGVRPSSGGPNFTGVTNGQVPVSLPNQRNLREGSLNGLGMANFPPQNASQGPHSMMQFENVVSPASLISGEGPGQLTQAATLRGLMQPPSDTSPLNTIQFSPATVPAKDWHQSINMDLRNHLIHKLVQAIFPYKDPSALQDRRMYNLISYARKVEADNYESANTREEYYQLLAEKIYKIQRELEEKRLKRNSERKLTVNGQPDVMAGLQGLGGSFPGATAPRGPTGLPMAVRQVRPSGPSDFAGNSPHMQMENGFPPRGGATGGLQFSGGQAGPGNGSFPASNGGYSGYNTPQHQTNFEQNFMQPKSEGDFRGHLSLGGGGDSQQSGQDDGGMAMYETKQEPVEASTGSPKHQSGLNSVKSEPGVKEEEGTGPGGTSSPLQTQPGPASVQSSAAESDTLKSEQDSMGGESSQENKMVLTGKDGKTPTKIHPPEELRTALMPLLDSLFYQEPECSPFRQPVDPALLGIPDYFDIVKNPIDLSTIRRKLENGEYNDPWQFVDDLWLMFGNAWIYNRKGSRVYKYSTKLSEVFEEKVDPVLHKLGYCCGRRYSFQPQVLCCYGKQLCTIPRDTVYMSYQNRYTYCQRCFADIPGDTVSLGDDPSLPMTNIGKDLFEEMKNDKVDYEPFVNCKLCGRKNHQICALHMDPIWPEGFVCDCCLRQQNARRKENRFSAKKLPTTKLGQHIENHINSYLQNKHITEAGEVTIRVLSSCDKTVEIKPGMKSKFGATKEIAETFPYRTKAIFAFEDIDGHDVCFFGMHVQEYGSDCPPPNSRRIYIAYLDSVHFFRPKHVRTEVYHEILLSYINYCKNLGYTMAHIWACPPSEGDDYVFHAHPPEQKIPKPKRLQEWYRRMLDKGITDGIIVEYKDILKHSMEDSVSCATELPYFEGDFWPNVMEECIKEVELLEQKEKEERLSVEDSDDSDDTGSEPGKGGKKRTKKAQTNKKQKGSAKGARKATKKGLGGISANANILTQKIFNTMDMHKDVFFVVRLHAQQRQTGLPEIVDPDPLISCELMDGRDAFLTMSREKHYEFSSLRRTKFSTLAMLFELHNQQGNDRFVYTCNSCKAHVETRYQCSVCDDFDLCVPCYEKEGHPHKMDRLGMDLDDVNVPKDPKATSADPSQTRHLYLQKFIQSLVHTAQCRDANCRLTSCQKMKRFIQHTRTCQKKQQGRCATCKQLIALCCYHAKQCNDTKCVVPFCNNIKLKIRTQRQQQDLQRMHFNRRRNALMTQQIRLGPGQPPGSLQMSSQNLSVPSPGGNSNNMSPHAPGVGLKGAGPSSGALDAARSVQEYTRIQASLANNGGKGGGGLQAFNNNPAAPGGGAFGGKNMNMPSGGHPNGGMGGKGVSDHFMGMGGGKPLMSSQSPPMNRALPPVSQSWPGGAPQNPGMNMMGPRGGAALPGALAGMMSQTGPAGAGQPMQMQQQHQLAQQNARFPGNQAHAQLLDVLKQPHSEQQQAQVGNILRANPQLMAMFLRSTRGPGAQNPQNQPGGRADGPPDPNAQAPPPGGMMMMQPGQAGPNQPQQQQQFTRMSHPGQPGQPGQIRPTGMMYGPQGGLQGLGGGGGGVAGQQHQQFMPGNPMMGGGGGGQPMLPARMQSQPNFLNQGMGGGSVNFSQANVQQPGIRPARFTQVQQPPNQPPQPPPNQYNLGMGPPSFNPQHQQQQQQSQQQQNQNPQLLPCNQQSAQQQQQDLNFLLQQQQQHRLTPGGPIRSPAGAALPVRSPQAQPSPSLGRQSTPGPNPTSASPRPLSGNQALHNAAYGSDGDGGHHGGHSGHMDPGGHGMGMPMSLQQHYGQAQQQQPHHQGNNNSLTPQDQLNKFVDNL